MEVLSLESVPITWSRLEAFKDFNLLSGMTPAWRLLSSDCTNMVPHRSWSMLWLNHVRFSWPRPGPPLAGTCFRSSLEGLTCILDPSSLDHWALFLTTNWPPWVTISKSPVNSSASRAQVPGANSFAPIQLLARGAFQPVVAGTQRLDSRGLWRKAPRHWRTAQTLSKPSSKHSIESETTSWLPLLKKKTKNKPRGRGTRVVFCVFLVQPAKSRWDGCCSCHRMVRLFRL